MEYSWELSILYLTKISFVIYTLGFGTMLNPAADIWR